MRLSSTVPSPDPDLREAEPERAPALFFDAVNVPGGRLSFTACAGDVVHVTGGAPLAQLRVLAVASGHNFGGPGRCEIAGLDTKTLTPEQREVVRAKLVARALLSDSLQAGLPLLDNVAKAALLRGTPAHEALRRAALELDALGLAEQQSLPPSVLSGAQTRLALVGRALVCRPRLLVVERPELGLGTEDLNSLRIALWSAASTHGCCVVMTSSHPRLAASATQRVALPEPAAVGV